jgi:hypothetical protein
MCYLWDRSWGRRKSWTSSIITWQREYYGDPSYETRGKCCMYFPIAISEVMWSALKWFMWSDFFEVKLSELRWSSWGQSTMYIRATLYWGYLIVMWQFHLVCTLYYGCFNLFCNVWVCVCVNFVMCGCFGIMCTCICCVLCCLYCVYVLLRLCIYRRCQKMYTRFKKGKNWSCAPRKTTMLPPFSLTVLPVAWWR